MRRSVRVRLLALALSIAALAVGTMALLAMHGGQWREESVSATSLAEIDREIRAALHGYATEHGSWDEVGPLVGDLARRTGRRIALTTPDGEPIVDSVRLLENSTAALPKAPVARIDATVPPDIQELTLPPNIVAGRPAEGVVSVYGWRLTDGERRRWQGFADQVADCVRHTAGVRPVVARYVTSLADGPAAPSPPDVCGPGGSPGPTEATGELSGRVAAAATACPADQHSPLWMECRNAVHTSVMRDYVAGLADLYLGESDRFDPFSPDGRWRTAATVAAVLGIAAAVSVRVGRRLADTIDGAGRQRQALLDDVAHELRNPLANVRGYLDAAQDGVVPVDRTLIQSLAEESALLERLVADLQDLALADAGRLRIEPEERDAAELAEAVVAGHRAHAETAGVDLVLSADEPVVVHADPTRLRQALANLVSNAMRHTPRGGTVRVAVRGSTDTVSLTVADTGTGIEAEQLPHIFDRRYQARPSGGAGLGLAITKYVVEAHHGRIDVTSAPDAGSTFTIRLPRTRR